MCSKSKWILGVFCAIAGATAQAAGSTSMGVSATVLSKSNCKFPTGTVALNFGTIDPSGSSNALSSAATTFVCNGTAASATFLITQDGGINNSGGNRMQHASSPGAFLPYTLSLTPTSGTVPKGATQSLTINGTIAATDYQQAIAGNYTDTVTLTISP